MDSWFSSSSVKLVAEEITVYRAWIFAIALVGFSNISNSFYFLWRFRISHRMIIRGIKMPATLSSRSMSWRHRKTHLHSTSSWPRRSWNKEPIAANSFTFNSVHNVFRLPEQILKVLHLSLLFLIFNGENNFIEEKITCKANVDTWICLTLAILGWFVVHSRHFCNIHVYWIAWSWSISLISNNLLRVFLTIIIISVNTLLNTLIILLSFKIIFQQRVNINESFLIYFCDLRCFRNIFLVHWLNIYFWLIYCDWSTCIFSTLNCLSHLLGWVLRIWTVNNNRVIFAHLRIVCWNMSISLRIIMVSKSACVAYIFIRVICFLSYVF